MDDLLELPIDEVADGPLADSISPDTCDGITVGEFIRVHGEIGTVWRVMRFDRFPDRDDEVLTYGGTRKKDEWIDCSFHTFTVDRIAERLKTRLTPAGGEVVIR